MCELTNQQAYDYYQKLESPSAKGYWFKFLKNRVDRGGRDAKGAQEQIDKIEFYKQLRAHSLKIKQVTGPTILNNQFAPP